jgi:hypothetical protein
MTRTLPMVCAVAFALPVFAQNQQQPVVETTTITTTTTTVESEFDLIGELWSVQDATPVECGSVDLRFTGQWITANAPANKGDSDDDFVLTPSIVWGIAEEVEVFARVPSWIGDGGNIPGDEGEVGNFDTYAGLLWRFVDGDTMDWAFQGTARIPTGDQSNGIDGEFRLIVTNEYESGLRSHFNLFAYTSNTTNIDNNRHLQCGAVVGLDGPLGDSGDLRWVLDYMNRTSTEYGHGNTNLLDVGWQWQMADNSKLGMSAQVGLDHSDDEAPNFGATITYAHALTY